MILRVSSHPYSPGIQGSPDIGKTREIVLSDDIGPVHKESIRNTLLLRLSSSLSSPPSEPTQCQPRPTTALTRHSRYVCVSQCVCVCLRMSACVCVYTLRTQCWACEAIPRQVNFLCDEAGGGFDAGCSVEALFSIVQQT